MAEATAVATPPGKAPAAATSATPLDDVMLAMDVVDTLRHADKLVERELSSDERDRQLKERLRQIYAAQGIEVPDHVLDEGVAALREDRFVYRPPPAGLGRSLALVWINRGRWLKGVLAALALVALLGGGYYFGVQLPAEQRIAQEASERTEILPRQIAGEVDRIKTIAKVDEANRRADTLAAEAQAALRAGDLPAARAKVAELRALRGRLEQAYVLRIVSRPGESSGVWRVPRNNPMAKNYYIIVEALDAKGQPVKVDVSSEEDGQRAATAIWGLRVNQQVFDRVRADKADDGIIQNSRFGEKRPGYLEPEYAYPTTGGAILQWR